MTLISAIAATLRVLRAQPGDLAFETQARNLSRLMDLQRKLPSGAGIACGTKIEVNACKPSRIVLSFSFHHMNDIGYYDGWTEHTAVITPSFDGINMRITGLDRNQVKDYLYDVFYAALTAEE